MAEGETWRGEAVVLVKPQFEAGREHVGKGGIVREQAGREIAIERVKECVVGLGGTGVEVIDSPITGWKGIGSICCMRSSGRQRLNTDLHRPAPIKSIRIESERSVQSVSIGVKSFAGGTLVGECH